MARNMNKWLGDGGMALLGDLGLILSDYGEGWVEGAWIPTPKACNPNGPVQGGVYSVVTDAVMSFATLSALEKGEHCTLLEMKTSFLRGATQGNQLRVRGEVGRVGRTVAFCRATVTNTDGKVVVETTGTNLLFRAKSIS